MPNRFARGHRDANEPCITEVLKLYGVPYGLLPEGFGADLLVFLSPMILVEVKNPAQPPSARALTQAEEVVRGYCFDHRIPYHVVETPEGMAEIIVNSLEMEALRCKKLETSS